MNTYHNDLFETVLQDINGGSQNPLSIELISGEVHALQYYLTNKSYYAVVVDDYPAPIVDKQRLLEALYYQVRLISVHDLNWDAIDEGLSIAISTFIEFEGICLLFKNAVDKDIPDDFAMLLEIIGHINEQDPTYQIRVLLCANRAIA